MRILPLLAALLLHALVPAANAADAAAPAQTIDEKQRDALHSLLKAHPGTVVRAARGTGIPELLRNDALAKAAAPTHAGRVVAALEFLARHKALYRLHSPVDELLLERTRSDALGAHHYVFRQHVRGIPLRDAELRVHFTADGALYAITTDTSPTPAGIDTEARISSADAQAIVGAHLVDANAQPGLPQLELHMIDGEYRLVYRIESFVHAQRWHSVVDAQDGTLLRHFREQHESHVAASGVDLHGARREFNAWRESGSYWLVDVMTPRYTGSERPLQEPGEQGDSYVADYHNTEGETRRFVSNGTADGGWDAAGVSALANGKLAHDYFRDVHGRRSIDDAGASLSFVIHYGQDYDNAFWNGRDLVFGDGGRRYSNLAGCLDLVGHEMAHGVIEHSAGLRYENQSGALNESLADTFGTLIEGRNWLIAEGCTKVLPGYMRSMPDPHHSRGWQPAHMSEYRTLPNTEDGDWGGVHVNSGIPNRAAWLLAEGLESEGLGTSIGRHKAGKLYYRALTVYLAPASTFIDLRRALLLAANDLFPGDAAVRDAVVAAFDAVGIVEGGDDSIGEAVGSGTLQASSTLLDFGDVKRGEQRALSLMLINDSPADVVIERIALDDPRFSHNFAGVTLAPGSTLEGTIVFDSRLDDNAGSGTRAAEIIFHAGEDKALAVGLLATVTTADAPATADGGGGAIGLLALLPFGSRAMRRRKAAAKRAEDV